MSHTIVDNLPVSESVAPVCVCVCVSDDFQLFIDSLVSQPWRAMFSLLMNKAFLLSPENSQLSAPTAGQIHSRPLAPLSGHNPEHTPTVVVELPFHFCSSKLFLGPLPEPVTEFPSLVQNLLKLPFNLQGWAASTPFRNWWPRRGDRNRRNDENDHGHGHTTRRPNYTSRWRRIFSFSRRRRRTAAAFSAAGWLAGWLKFWPGGVRE